MKSNQPHAEGLAARLLSEELAFVHTIPTE
jgi:hypothetical protein